MASDNFILEEMNQEILSEERMQPKPLDPPSLAPTTKKQITRAILKTS